MSASEAKPEALAKLKALGAKARRLLGLDLWAKVLSFLICAFAPLREIKIYAKGLVIRTPIKQNLKFYRS